MKKKKNNKRKTSSPSSASRKKVVFGSGVDPRDHRKLECLGMMANGIAHDFNNILWIILSHLYMVERTQKNDPFFLNGIDAIKKSVQRGSELSQQILKFIASQGAQKKPVHLNKSIQDLLILLRGAFPKTITIQAKLDQSISEIMLDENKFQQAMLNLCINARDAMLDGGILTIETKIIKNPNGHDGVKTTKGQDCVKIVVKDNGSGIDSKTKKEMMKPYFSTKEEGRGIGLSVVNDFLTDHKGHLVIDTSLGNGSKFTLFLPCKLAKTI